MFYAIRHVTKFQYDEPVSETVMEVRKHPRTEGNQRCLNHSLRVTPRARVFSYRDYLGNMVHHFDVPGRYARLMLTAESLVELEPFPSVAPLHRDAWMELDAQVAQGDYWEMLMPSVFARPSQELNEVRDQLQVQRGADPLTTVRDIQAKIYEHFDYETKSTKVDSPIELALRNGKGVCQDFAHIMIAFCRELKIPCRYVSGYLFHNQARDRSADGATHAWVEAFLPRIGWLGIDPTNDLLACDRHVRTAIGRDYADVPPTKGVFKGDSRGQLSVSVRVTLSDAPPEPEAVAQEQWVVKAEPDATSSDQQQQQQQQ
ncbi:MAG TPA: transglutaminase family protein [Bryobacteraceae bacterium]|nr:transglutaminase family protein [Bryobacteraceae bacterium]